MPWVDTLFAVPELDTPVFEKQKKEEEDADEAGIWGADWTPVRSVRTFVGIAYAIVRSSPFAIDIEMLMCDTEKAPLDLNPAILPHTRARQSGPLVPNRSPKARFHSLYRRRRNGHRAAPRLEPIYDTFSSLRRKLNNTIPTFAKGWRLAGFYWERVSRARSGY